MRTKNAAAITVDESAWLRLVKEQPCAVCSAPPPSEAHHTKQGNHFTATALCIDCHRGPLLGWHGQRRMWSVKKMDENDALNVTVRNVLRGLT